MSFHIAGVKVCAGFSFFVVLIIFLILDPTGAASMVVLSALWHEAAHIAVMRALGVRLVSVSLRAFGVGITTAGLNTGYAADMLIAAAGPISNMFLGLAAFFIFGARAQMFMLINMVMAVFNLLPVYPLDGGRILKGFAHRVMSEERARVLSWWVSLLMLIPVFTAAIFLCVSEKNFSLLITCAYLSMRVLTER